MSGSNGIQNVMQSGVSNGTSPNIGQVYSFYLTLTANVPQAIDLKSLVNLHRVGDVQGIMIDNSAGTASLSVSTAAGQLIVVPAGSQALMPLYLSADKVITFAGTVTNARMVLLNFPTPAAVWEATGSAGGGGSPSSPIYTKAGPFSSAGASQEISATTSAQSLTVPSGATSAVISLTGGNVIFRDDGTAPTSTVGMTWNVGLNAYNGPLASLQFILASGVGSAALFVSYYE